MPRILRTPAVSRLLTFQFDAKREKIMADLKSVLGTMLVSGLAGRSAGRGAALASAAPMLLGGGTNKAGMSLGRKAGLAALAYLAYRTYQGGKEQPAANAAPPPPEKKGASGPFGPLFNALGVFQPKDATGDGQPAAAAPDMDDAQAMLLIRAMITAANADGEITAEERQQIVQLLDKAGAGAEERRIVEDEMRSPRSIDDIVRQVNGDQDKAEQVYVASRIALRNGSSTEQRYLDFLASRLNIPDARRQELSTLS
jgi:uncharacterized membrane protein YebE (DUF533 family)